MKKRGVLVASAVVFLGFAIFWCWTGYLHGQADFRCILEGREPSYAKSEGVYSDGGTEVFEGRSYRLYKMHRLLTLRRGDPTDYVILTGARLMWHLPIRIFAKDDEQYFYEPK